MTECAKARIWVENAEKVQATLKKYQDPPITVAEVQKIGTELVNVKKKINYLYFKYVYLEMQTYYDKAKATTKA